MTAHSHSRGNDIRYNEPEQKWQSSSSGSDEIDKIPCRKCGKLPINVVCKISADLSCDGKEKWKTCAIDACISPIVKALQDGGIDMLGCCCGHGETTGSIALQDGRTLLIINKQE